MELLSSPPFWPVRDGLPDTFPALTADVTCDVAVIGAGISGALMAWHLAEAGLDTVVLDRREVAHGSTAGNTGLLLYELDEPLHRLADRYGVEFAQRAYLRCRDALGGLERIVRRIGSACDFERKTSLYLPSSPAHVPPLRREFEARRAAGLAVEWWPRGRIARESTLPHAAAIWSRDAAMLDVYQFTYDLLAAARRRGVRIYDRTAVTGRRMRVRGVELRTARGALVRARELVIAAGYEAGRFLPHCPTALQSTFVWVSEPVADLRGWPADGALLWETARNYVYLRPLADGRVMMGGYDVPFRDPAARDRLLARKVSALRRRFGQLFPRIPIEVACAWAGTFASTSSGLPFIGRYPGRPRMHFALGYGGNGITFSLIAAEIIRDALLGRRDRDTEVFGFERGV